MKRARDQFFAGTAFAADQHRRFGRCQFAEQFAQFADRLAVTEQFMFGLIDVNRALPAQARHAECPAKGDLHPRHVERQGVEIEKPFTDEVTDVL
ncbi:hypothetical protein D3C81_1775280 [compost metagenome]